MSELLLRHATWVAICDGKWALLLENRGTPESPRLETHQILEQENPPTHLQGSAPPGRAFSSVGKRRSAVEETDFHEQMERTFLASFAQILDDRVAKQDISALVLIAPPKALGVLRPHLTERTRRVLVAELDRDYVKVPIEKVERYLSTSP